MRLAHVVSGMLLVLLNLSAQNASALSDEQLTAVRDGFEQRREGMLRGQVAKPYPPASGGDHALVWNRLDYALAALYLNVELEQANRAVIEAAERSMQAVAQSEGKNARQQHPFHWETPLYCRIYEFFRPGSRVFPGRLTPQAAEAIRRACWQWAKGHARLANASPANAWRFWGSENISAMHNCAAWGCAQVLKDAPEYAARRYDDGSTAVQQYEAWTGYVKEYLRERVRRGLTVETASPTYSKYTLQCWYDYYDLAANAELRRLADAALTVYWTDWAQEQLGGVRGGGKSRCYQGKDCELGLDDGAAAMAWYYLGIGCAGSHHPGVMCMATTGHRLPLVVMDIALDVPGRGVYEYRSRRPGLCANPGAEAEADESERASTALAPELGGVVRYSYCTPEFILGANLVAKLPLGAWSGMSMQNRWQGVIFAGDPNARIFPQCAGLRNGKTYNQHWTVQSKGAMIVQKLPDRTYSKQAGAMRVWFAAGLRRTEGADWVFAQAQGAWAAVRPASGGYAWDDAHWLRALDAASPVIVQVARQTDYRSLDAFRAAVLAAKLELRNDTLTYQGLDGAGVLTFYLKSERLPEINGQPIDLRPAKTFDSPFLQEDWARGVVTIAKGSRRLTLDVGR